MHRSDEEDVTDRAPGPRTARRRGPRAHRRGRAWLAVTLALAAVVAGATLPHGLLMAAGLIASALAVDLLRAGPRQGRDMGAGTDGQGPRKTKG
ncbi:hypothetical protein [Streptomyces sp. NPDC048606]|uniref:hypothetical protein n=1 Tax=Streptomyces sp. NPDC048606 TaxID=3154726 RepID=UPI003426A359